MNLKMIFEEFWDVNKNNFNISKVMMKRTIIRELILLIIPFMNSEELQTKTIVVTKKFSKNSKLRIN